MITALQSVKKLLFSEDAPEASVDDVSIKDPNMIELEKKICSLFDRWTGEPNYRNLTRVIELMEKVSESGGHADLLPFLEGRSLVNDYLDRDFGDFVKRGYDRLIIGVLFRIHDACGSKADAAIRTQCMGTLSAIEEFRSRRINDIHERMIYENRSHYMATLPSFLKECVECTAWMKSMPKQELSFMLLTLVCYHKCLSQDFHDDSDETNDKPEHKRIGYKVLKIISECNLSYLDEMKTIGNIRRSIPGTWSNYLYEKYIDNISDTKEFYRVLLDQESRLNQDRRTMAESGSQISELINSEEEHPEDYNMDYFIKSVVDVKSGKDWRLRKILTSKLFTIDELRPIARALTRENMEAYIKFAARHVVMWPCELYELFYETLCATESTSIFMAMSNTIFPELGLTAEDTRKAVLDARFSRDPLETVLTLTHKFECGFLLECEHSRTLYIGYMYKLFWNIDNVDLEKYGLDSKSPVRSIWARVLDTLDGVNESVVETITTNDKYVKLIPLLPLSYMLWAFRDTLSDDSATMASQINAINRIFLWVMDNKGEEGEYKCTISVLDDLVPYVSLVSRKIRSDYERYHQHRGLREFLSQHGLTFDSDPILSKIVGDQRQHVKVVFSSPTTSDTALSETQISGEIRYPHVTGFRLTKVVWTSPDRILLIQGGEYLFMVDTEGYQVWRANIGTYDIPCKWAIVGGQRVYTTNRYGIGIILDLETGNTIAHYNKLGNNRCRSVKMIMPDAEGRWKVITKSGIHIVEEGEFYKKNKEYYCGGEREETLLRFDEVSKLPIDISTWDNLRVCGNYVCAIPGPMSYHQHLKDVYYIPNGTLVDIPRQVKEYSFGVDHVFLRKENKLYILAPDGTRTIMEIDGYIVDVSIHNSTLGLITKHKDKVNVQLIPLAPDNNHGSPVILDVPGSISTTIHPTDDGFIINHSKEKEYIRIIGTNVSTVPIPDIEGYQSVVIGYHGGYVVVSTQHY